MARYVGTKPIRGKFRKQEHDPDGDFVPYNKNQKCVTGKKKYGAIGEARRILREMNYREPCGDLEIYLCTHCGTYHLGNSNEFIRLMNHENALKEMGE